MTFKGQYSEKNILGDYKPALKKRTTLNFYNLLKNALCVYVEYAKAKKVLK